MRRRSHLGLGLTALSAMLLSATAMVAPPASAGTIALTLDCLHDASLYANVGDTVVITLAATCPNNLGFVSSAPGNGFGFLTAQATANSGDYSIGDPTSWYVYSNGSGNTTITTTLLGQDLFDPISTLSIGVRVARLGPDDGMTDYWMTYGGPAAPTQGTNTNVAPPSWFQSVGRVSPTSTCAAGWHPSWAQWMNAQSGGWVCDREEFWNGSGWSYRGSRKP